MKRPLLIVISLLLTCNPAGADDDNSLGWSSQVFNAMHKTKDYPRAEKILRKVLSDPELSEWDRHSAQRELIECLEKQNNPAAAVDVIKGEIKRLSEGGGPTHALVAVQYAKLAYFYEKSKNAALAQQAFSEAYRIVQQDEERRKKQEKVMHQREEALRMVQAGRLKIAEQKLNNALKSARALGECNIEVTACETDLGRVKEERGRTEEALSLYKHASDLYLKHRPFYGEYAVQITKNSYGSSGGGGFYGCVPQKKYIALLEKLGRKAEAKKVELSIVPKKVPRGGLRFPLVPRKNPNPKRSRPLPPPN